MGLQAQRSTTVMCGSDSPESGWENGKAEKKSKQHPQFYCSSTLLLLFPSSFVLTLLTHALHRLPLFVNDELEDQKQKLLKLTENVDHSTDKNKQKLLKEKKNGTNRLGTKSEMQIVNKHENKSLSLIIRTPK